MNITKNIAKMKEAIAARKAEVSFYNKTVEACQRMKDHARSNIYAGPALGGAMYSGWPLTELVKTESDVQLHAILLKELKIELSRLGLPGSVLSPMPGNPIQAVAQGRATPTRPHSCNDMLAMRMHWLMGKWADGFAHVATMEIEDKEKVFVWVISKQGVPLTLEDESALFPSDTLITKLRMLQQE